MCLCTLAHRQQELSSGGSFRKKQDRVWSLSARLPAQVPNRMTATTLYWNANHRRVGNGAFGPASLRRGFPREVGAVGPIASGAPHLRCTRFLTTRVPVPVPGSEIIAMLLGFYLKASQSADEQEPG